MMNKKGQVLVVFVLILPIIILFLGLVIDIGNSLVIKKRYENTLKDIITYNYKTSDGDLLVIEKNIKKSVDNIEKLDIKVKDEILKVDLKVKYKSIFSNIFDIGLDTFNIKVEYDIKENKIVRE